MPSIVGNKLIKATPKTIFEIYDNPMVISELSEIVTDVKEYKKTKKRLGDAFDLTFRLGPITFKEQMKIVSYKKPSFVTVAFQGLVNGVLAFSIVNLGNGTCATFFSVDYEASGPLSAVENSMLVEKGFKRGLNNMMEALRVMAEGGMAVKKGKQGRRAAPKHSRRRTKK